MPSKSKQANKQTTTAKKKISVPGILQARKLEWVVISFSSAWKWKVKVKSLSLVRPSVTPWTAAHQAPPSMGFSRQEYWSGRSIATEWQSQAPNTDSLAPESSWGESSSKEEMPGSSEKSRAMLFLSSSSVSDQENWKWSCSVVSDPQWPHGLQPTRLLHPWEFPGKSTGVGCHCLLRNTLINIL